jgi:hypothetical protein
MVDGEEVGVSTYVRHRIRKVATDLYVISWAWDVRYSQKRFREIRQIRRVTDRAGAERFACKWGITFAFDSAA